MVEVSIGTGGGLSEEGLRHRLAEEGGLTDHQLGRVEVMGDVSLFEVKEPASERALKSFKGFKLSGQKVRARRKS
jgi:hypothetical protein